MDKKETDFLDELKYCIEQNDVIKAVALLQFFPTISTKCQRNVLFEILKADDQTAYPMLFPIS